MPGPSRLYKNKEGRRVPSVTTILSKFKDAGGLIYWANQQGLDGKTLEEARQEAATPGTIAHDMVEFSLTNPGEPMKEFPGEQPFFVERAAAAYRAYLKWRDSYNIKLVFVEQKLVSEKLQVGGRLDAVGCTNPDAIKMSHEGHITNPEDLELSICDWKTGNSLYADHLFQLAAYGVLWEENYPQFKLTGGFHLCRFSKESGDFAHHHFDNLDAEAETFARMRDLYDRVKATEKRAK